MRRQRGDDDVHVILLLQALAEVNQRRGDMDAAEAALRELVDVTRRSSHRRTGLPACLNSLAGLLAEKGEFAAAVPLSREALEIAQSERMMDRPSIGAMRGNLAWLLAMTGQFDEAEPLILETFERAPPHPAGAASADRHVADHPGHDPSETRTSRSGRAVVPRGR